MEIMKGKSTAELEVNKIMNPAFLLGTAFNIAYWHRKYHSGTICKGVSNPLKTVRISEIYLSFLKRWKYY